MNRITYRKLTEKDCEGMKDMDASQFIKRAWREVKGERKLVEINYLDPTWPGGFEDHYNCLKATIDKKGCAIGAFDFAQNQMVGFITVEPEFFGVRDKYVLLDQLYVSRPYRSQGIGKKLFTMAAEEAQGWKADKFYIAAGSAEETIAFYFALGCRKAVEINQEIYESDPRDYQMEYSL